MRPRRLIIGWIILLAPLVLTAQEGGGKRVAIKEDRISASVSDAPLFDVLTEISAVTGMEVKVDPEVNRSVTCSFEDLPIDRGIARLVHPLDYVIKWKRVTEGAELFEEITSVEVFKKGEREKAKQLLSPAEPPHGPGDVQRDETIHSRNDEKMRLHPTPARIKRPRRRYRSSIQEVDKGKSGAPQRETGETTGRVRIRKFEAVTGADAASDDASYDELSP